MRLRYLSIVLTVVILIHLPMGSPLASAQLPPPASGSYEWLLATEEKFDNPLFVTHAGDGSGRLFVVEQPGYIWIVRDRFTLPEPFLNISSLLSDEVFRGGYTERGLLGLAFHPDYARNGAFFITYARRDKMNILARYRVSADDPNRADPASEELLLSYEHPHLDHHGGMIAFGPDGYLYMSVGDGGGTQGDPEDDAQSKESLLGKLLRVDVSGGDPAAGRPYAIPPTNPFAADPRARPEIWAFGLRNPWRFSFDRATGDMYIGDVGWGRVEEINYAAAGSAGGQNYGWNVFEGNYRFEDKTDPGATVPPIAQYEHTDGACSVTGGYVYRGPGAPTLRGVYVFGDYCVGRVWALWRAEADQWQMKVLIETGMQISSFGEDEMGGLYLVHYKGYLYRLRER